MNGLIRGIKGISNKTFFFNSGSTFYFLKFTLWLHKKLQLISDKNQTKFTFSKLPEFIGSGHAYDITIVAIVETQRTDKITKVTTTSKVESPVTKERFMTKPLPPVDLR